VVALENQKCLPTVSWLNAGFERKKKLLNAVDEIPFSGKISSHCSQIYCYNTGACTLVSN
jgi:hypothetical protein